MNGALEVFPDAVLWLYPPYRTGILVGRKGVPGLVEWPGLRRASIGRELSSEIVKASVQLAGNELDSFASRGTIITDDNQYLAYGWASHRQLFVDSRSNEWESTSMRWIEESKNLSIEGRHS